MNLPNKLTVLRVIMVPFFVFFMLTGVGGAANKWIALIIFCVASLTDMLDGKIARARNLVTNFGKFMDPLADKLLVCSAMICMIPLGKLQAWFVIVIIAREFIISGFRLVAADNDIVIAASYWGKFKTVSQMFMLILLIADLGGAFNMIAQVLIWVSLVLTIVSLIDYIAKNVQMDDGNARVLYADIKSKADAGTFLFDTEGELLGWATDRYDQETENGMETFMSISDYKGVLELLSNGIPVPYLGIEGQEVTTEMEKNGMPAGIYITALTSESPAYNAGLQPGDILDGINDVKIEGMKNFQAQVEKLHVGDHIAVTVQRNNGKDEYKQIEFEVTVGAR